MPTVHDPHIIPTLSTNKKQYQKLSSKSASFLAPLELRLLRTIHEQQTDHHEPLHSHQIGLSHFHQLSSSSSGQSISIFSPARFFPFPRSSFVYSSYLRFHPSSQPSSPSKELGIYLSLQRWDILLPRRTDGQTDGQLFNNLHFTSLHSS